MVVTHSLGLDLQAPPRIHPRAAAILINAEGEAVSTVVGVVHDSQTVSPAKAEAAAAVADSAAAAGGAASSAEVSASDKSSQCIQM